MKKLFWIILLLPSISQAQRSVRDIAVTNQLERRAYRWNRDWRPDYVFFDYYDLLHSDYKSKKRNIPTQLAPNLLTRETIYLPALEDQRKEGEDLAQVYITDDLNKEGGILDDAYQFKYKSIFNDLLSQMSQVTISYLKEGGETSVAKEATELIAIYRSDIQTINKSYLPKGKRIESYSTLEQKIRFNLDKLVNICVLDLRVKKLK